MLATHTYCATTGECLGEELDSDLDIAGCLLILRQKTFSNVETNLHNKQKKHKETYICKKA